MIDAIEIRVKSIVKSIGKTWVSSVDGLVLVVRDLNHPLLMTPVQSQAETVFSFSEILFHM
jgi:hypothetical protein